MEAQTVKVKFTTGIAGPRFGYGPGDVADLQPDEAKPWLASGICVEVDDAEAMQHSLETKVGEMAAQQAEAAKREAALTVERDNLRKRLEETDARRRAAETEVARLRQELSAMIDRDVQMTELLGAVKQAVADQPEVARTAGQAAEVLGSVEPRLELEAEPLEDAGPAEEAEPEDKPKRGRKKG